MSYRAKSGGGLPAEGLVRWFSERLRDWPVWAGIILLYITLEIAVLSLEQADWIAGMPPLSLVLIIAVPAGWLLSSTRFKGLLLLVILAVAGGGAVYLFGLNPSLGVGQLLFSLFLSALVWAAGTVSAWAVVRRRNAWPGVISGVLILLVNLSNLPDGYFAFLGFFFPVAMVFVVHMRLSRFTGAEGSPYPRQGRFFLPAAVIIIAIIGTSLAWLSPQLRMPGLQNAIATHLTWTRDLRNSSINIFAAVPAKQPSSTSMTRTQIGFGSNWHKEDKIDYIISSPYATYWRIQAYDIYTAEGWQNSQSTPLDKQPGEVWKQSAIASESSSLTYQVTSMVRTDSLLTGGNFVSADVPHVLHVRDGDVLNVTTPRIMAADETYSVTTAVYSPTIEELAAVQPGHPAAIGIRYLELPDDFPEKVRNLARIIAGGAETPYEKVLKLGDYLDRFSYRLDIPGPQEGEDGVAYFLFDEKAGFCTYFASAMAVMLRAVDVPARLAVGYLPGDPGDEPGQYVLKDKYYHAWTQAWFNGLGWVDLEVTPGGSGSEVNENRSDDPVISVRDIQGLPPWELWYQQQMLPPGTGGELPEDFWNETNTGKSPPGPLSFADELGRAFMVIGIIAAAGLVLSVPVMLVRSSFRRWLWHVDRSDIVARTYLVMGRLAGFANLAPAPSQTPMEYAEALSGVIPEQQKDLDLIIGAYVQKKFGRAGDPNLFEEAEILKARVKVYKALINRMGPLRRIFGERY